MKQRTREWRHDRLGKITASNAHKIMSDRGLGKTGETYIYELVAGSFGVDKEEVDSASMRWGRELEEDARMYYELACECDVELTGFIEHLENDQLGFSPDGIINDRIGYESKCPYNPGIHIKHMMIKNGEDLKKLHLEYYWQIMFSFYCSDLIYWHFVSYDPRFTGKQRMHIVRIDRNSYDLELIEKRVKEALELKQKIENIINNGKSN